jgi:hypothetical protein
MGGALIQHKVLHARTNWSLLFDNCLLTGEHRLAIMVHARDAGGKYPLVRKISIEGRKMQTVANKKPLKKTIKFQDGVEKKIEVSLETPEPTDFQDAVNFFGGQDGTFSFLKKSIRDNARKAAGLILNSVSTPDQLDDAIVRAQRESKNYSYTGASKSEKANILDDIAAMFDTGNLSEDKLRELLARAK